MKIDKVSPAEIEKRSFELITEELTDLAEHGKIPPLASFPEDELTVIKRCIHTTADFDYVHTMRFSEGAVDKLKELIRSGASIVTDTNMALAGVNRRQLSKYGCSAYCFMADESVAEEAAERGITRAAVSMERAMTLPGNVIFVVGNAPTALITLREFYDSGKYEPAFVVGVPVGFVNVVASKEMILDSGMCHIVNAGRKGGSTVAAAIVNAVFYMVRDEG